MAVVKLADGSVVDSDEIDCGLYAKMFIEDTLESTDDGIRADLLALRFVRATMDVIAGVMVDKTGVAHKCEHRNDLLKVISGAVRALDLSYPELGFRAEFAKQLSISNRSHYACLVDGRFSLQAKIAAAWWDAQIIRSCSAKAITLDDLDSALWDMYENRSKIDQVYRDLSNEIASRIDEALYHDKAIKFSHDSDWMVELMARADERLNALKEGGRMWYLFDETMKVTTTRVLITRENRYYELFSGSPSDTLSDEAIYAICWRYKKHRPISFAEYLLDN